MGRHATFRGSLGGSAVAGAAINISGILDGLTATAAADSSFSVVGFFPARVDGFAGAVAVDTQEGVTDIASLYVTLSGP